MEKTKKKKIGRIEKIHFPNWSLTNLDAKVDTGAYTSSLHCHHIKEFIKGDERWIQFNVLDPDHPEYESILYTSKVHDIRKVKSSNAIAEERFVIKEEVLFSGETRSIELSLTDRSGMKYPILLGRKFLNKYIIDTSRKYLTEIK